MRFIELFQNNRSLGRHDVPDHVHADNGLSYRIYGATRMGGNGVVFDAAEKLHDVATGKSCAVKVLKQLNPARIDRFNNEVRVLKELQSPYISAHSASGTVAVVPQVQGTQEVVIPWVAMQLGGSNMRQHVEDHGPLSMQQLKSITFGLCSAVEHLHSKGFIHRDIKPDNFVWRTAANTAPMMIDFGIAKRQSEDVSARPMDTFTRVTEFVGPVFFSSPELIEYAKDKAYPVDYRSDIFQLGKVLWYLGTGKVSAGVPSRKECPADGKLRELVLAMIDDDPSYRPQALSEVRDAMNAI
ncbi:serine/threonine protein kinase [Ideonella livida]|uniref:Serine/threonine protein kinase n=1 Tax=Ideonella livida TaxID=2707176 RepID=A0A7C9TLS0_9BURK|nr:serine/threonine-protein kinase [Ideonella livida]NDY91787.1 serine/threonine protein kinase [Ideonella livida]